MTCARSSRSSTVCLGIPTAVRRVVVPSTLPPALDRLVEAAENDLRDHTMAPFQPDFREPNVTSVVLSLRRARQWRMAELVLGLRAESHCSELGLWPALGAVLS